MADRRDALLNAYKAQLRALEANLQLQLETLRAQESLEAQTAYEAAAVARLRTIDNITTQGIESFINEIRKLQDTIQSLLDSKEEYDSEADFFVAFDKLISDYENIVKKNIGQLGFLNNRIKIISQQIGETNSSNIEDILKGIFNGIKDLHSKSGIKYDNLFLGLLLVYISTSRIPQDYLFTPVASYISWIASIDPNLIRGALGTTGIRQVIESIPVLDNSVRQGYDSLSSTLSRENLLAMQQMVSDNLRNLTLEDMGIYIESGDFSWEALDTLPHTPSVSAASSVADSVAESVALSVADTEQLIKNIGNLRQLARDGTVAAINGITDSATGLYNQAARAKSAMINQMRSTGMGIAAAAGTFVGKMMPSETMSDSLGTATTRERAANVRYGRDPAAASALNQVFGSQVSDISLDNYSQGKEAEEKFHDAIEYLPSQSTLEQLPNDSGSEQSPFTQDLSIYSNSSINTSDAGNVYMPSDDEDLPPPMAMARQGSSIKRNVADAGLPVEAQLDTSPEGSQEKGGRRKRKSRHHKKSKASKKRKGKNQKGGKKTKKGKKHHKTLKRHRKRSQK
jgi:hypothetical protein